MASLAVIARSIRVQPGELLVLPVIAISDCFNFNWVK